MKPDIVLWISDNDAYEAILAYTFHYSKSVTIESLEVIMGGAKYILLKVASLLVTLGFRRLAAEGILGNVSRAAGATKLDSAIMELIADTILARLYIETQFKMINDIEILKRIWSDSIKASKAAIQKAIPSGSGVIENVGVNIQLPITDCIVARKSMTLVNTGAEPAKITVFINIYDESGNPIMFVRSPENGSEILGPSVATTFSSPEFSVCDSYSSLQKYRVEVYAVIGCNIIGPVITGLVNNLRAITYYGAINQGDEILISYVAPEDTRGLSLFLFYLGGRLDLHVYDEHGNHVGVNYETGMVEEQIEGSSHSGIYNYPQVIKIGGDLSNKTFTIKIVGFQTFGEENFTLIIERTPSLPPILDVFPGELCFNNRIDPLSPFATTFLLVGEAGGQEALENVRINITDLTDGDGHRIPSSSIAIEPNSLNISAGQWVGIVLNVTIPQSISPGNYTGTIYVSASNQTIIIPVRFEYVTLQYLISESLRKLKDYVNSLPPEDFSEKQKVSEMKRALSNKIDAVIKMVEEGAYNGAINKLENDILAKVDGDPNPKDWIIEPDAQTILKNWIGWIIMNIKKLL